MLFNSSRLAEVEEYVGRVLQPHALNLRRPNDRLVTRMDARHVNGVSTSLLAYGTEVSIIAREFENFYILLLPLRGTGSVGYGRDTTQIDATRGAIVSPLKQFRTALDPTFVKLVAKIDRAALDLHALALDCVAPVEFLLECGFDPAGADLGAAIRACYAAFGNDATVHEAALARSRLLTAMLRANGTAPTASPTLSTRRSRAIVHAGELYIETHADEPLTIELIARAIGTTPRSLFAAFRAHREATPLAHLHAVRLHRARVDLGSGEQILVTEIAMKHGFSHLGRFAAAYRQLFHEPPSATLARASGSARPSHKHHRLTSKCDSQVLAAKN